MGRGFVLGVSLLALLGAGCTPDATTPPPTTSTSATPSESAQEREERVAYEAAEKSYREFRAEFYEVLRSGGSNSATPTMKRTAAGPYLSEATEIVQAYRGEKGRSEGQEAVVFVRGNGYEATELALLTCDDTTRVKTLDKRGRTISRGELRASEITARLIDGEWKIWAGTGKPVKSCADA